MSQIKLTTPLSQEPEFAADDLLSSIVSNIEKYAYKGYGNEPRVKVPDMKGETCHVGYLGVEQFSDRVHHIKQEKYYMMKSGLFSVYKIDKIIYMSLDNKVYSMEWISRSVHKDEYAMMLNKTSETCRLFEKGLDDVFINLLSDGDTLFVEIPENFIYDMGIFHDRLKDKQLSKMVVFEHKDSKNNTKYYFEEVVNIDEL